MRTIEKPTIPGDRSNSEDEERTATKKVIEFIRNRIVGGEFKQNKFLSEALIQKGLRQANLEYSRAPIREALLALASQQLVNIVPRRGTFVREISREEIKEILTARLVLEQHVVRQLVSTPNVDLKDAQDINNKMRKLTQSADYSRDVMLRFADLDGLFHRTLSDLAGFHTTFSRLLTEMRDRFRLLALPSVRPFGRRTVREHQHILNAIRQKGRRLTAKIEAAEGEVRTHLQNALDRWDIPAADKHYIKSSLSEIFEQSCQPLAVPG